MGRAERAVLAWPERAPSRAGLGVGSTRPAFPSSAQPGSNPGLVLLQFLQCHGQTGLAQGNPGVPAPQHLSLEQWSCREVPTAPTYSTPGTSRRLQLRAPAQGSYLGEVRLQTPLWGAGGHSRVPGEQSGVPVCLGGPCRALGPLLCARGRPGEQGRR